MAEVLRLRRGVIDPTKLLSPAVRRLDYEGTRPIECGPKPGAKKPGGESDE
jgi:hypothetical protein